jgi:uncharacterized membrane protein
MRLLLLVAAVAVSQIACGPTCKDPKNPPSYAAVVEPIVIAKCQTCHSRKKSGAARKAAPDDTNYDTYDQTFSIHQTAAQRVAAKEMPPASENTPLTDAEIETYTQWSYCGAAP